MDMRSGIPLPKLYDFDMKPIGRLHPTKAGYDLKLTPLSTCTLELVGESVKDGQFVELYDAFGDVGVFRAYEVARTRGTKEQEQIKLEHAFATLGDTVIPGYFEFGGVGTTTRSVLAQLLAKQRKVYWVLGDCDFSYAYQYSVENEYLINAILSVPGPFVDAYQWEFDTSVFPFVLHLRKAPTHVTMELRLNRNIQTVKQTVDRSELRTRLYPRGYGEGVNQLTIRSVNGGVDYLEKNTAMYGIIEDIYPDTKITDPATLKAAAQAVLEGCSTPKVTTEVSGDDVFALTGEPLDRFRCGALGRVPVLEYGISIEERVVEVRKTDLYAADQKSKLVFSNQKSDMVAETARLIRKSRIAELYSQGSTCIYAISFNGNCDAQNPLEVWIPVDTNAASINVFQIKYRVTAFRAYSKAASASGGQARSSDAGTQATAEIPAQVFASTVNMTGPIDGYGDDMTLTDGPFGDLATETDAATGRTGASGDITTQSSGSLTTGTGNGNTGESDDTSHSHSTAYHNHGSNPGLNVRVSVNSNTCSHSHPAGSHTHNISGHSHIVPSHSHTLNSHKHTISVHQHGMNHKHGVSIGFRFPDMTINVSGHSHVVTFEDHTHPIEYGIFNGTTAQQVTVKLGDNVVPAAISDTKDFDAVPYMEKDSDGRIVRGWHKLTFVPDRMTGISGTAYIKTFVTAFAGGNY